MLRAYAREESRFGPGWSCSGAPTHLPKPVHPRSFARVRSQPSKTQLRLDFVVCGDDRELPAAGAFVPWIMSAFVRL